MNYVALRELQDEATMDEYLWELNFSNRMDIRKEEENIQGEIEYNEAVWAVLEFIVCFNGRDKFLAVESVVSSFADVGDIIRKIDLETECLRPNYIPF